MPSREAVFPTRLYIGAMESKELSRVQMVGVGTGLDSLSGLKSASVAHFICLPPTDSEFAPLRYLQ
jgi:hypothetical protein